MSNIVTKGARVAVVTGAARGIGSEIAARLRADGHKVASLDVIDPVDPITGVSYLTCDIADRTSVESALDELRGSLGPIAIVVHCAAYQVIAPFAELKHDDSARTMDVNVGGAFNVIQAALPDLLAAGWGRVVCITSSTQWAPPPGMSHYVASKGALTGLVRSLAVEVGPAGVTVNAVAPGLIGTEHAFADVPREQFDTVLSRQAIKRAGRPGDIAGAVSFVVSDDAEFMTGQTLLIDGGESRI